MIAVNDVHSRLNATAVREIVTPATVDEVSAAIARARANDVAVSVAGRRHAMGGQQFVSDGLVIDVLRLNRILDFDSAQGLISVEAGIEWPALINYLRTEQPPDATQWGIVQKQTGADRLTLGGALAANVHGRGLALKPIVDQIDAFDLMTDGGLLTCSRQQHRELFQLAIGGYGLFGVVTRITLRLCPRVKVRRVVSLVDAADVMDAFDDRIRAGFTYGDFQFAIDPTTDMFLRRGVFSCYEPVPDNVPATASPIRFQPEDWSRLTVLAHTDKRRAFDAYAERYLETSGQVYWADEQQLTVAYLDDYHRAIDRVTNAAAPGSEMITEILVPRACLAAFMEDARAELIRHDANVIYGTVRLIEAEDETVLAWARDRYACVVLNLHVDHTEPAIARSAEAFRALIDLGLRHGGSYYLTYHRWARRDQVEAGHPRFVEFLKKKRDHDPFERFQSDWYRHYREMFAGS